MVRTNPAPLRIHTRNFLGYGKGLNIGISIIIPIKGTLNSIPLNPKTLIIIPTKGNS